MTQATLTPASVASQPRMRKSILHLTYSGYNAGKVICGAVKTTEADYLHAQYIDDVLARPHCYAPLCSECKAIMDSLDDEE